MVVVIVVVVVLLICVAVGVWGYLRGAPPGGREDGLGEVKSTRRRMERRTQRNHTFEKAEAKFQREQAEKAARELPPTHEQP